MLGAVTFESTLQPTIYRPVMTDNIVVHGRLKFIGVKDLNRALLPPRPDRLSLSEINFNVHHPMWKRFQSGVKVDRTIKNKITRQYIFLCQILIREQIKLIGLIPFAKSVTELLSQIKDALPNESAAI